MALRIKLTTFHTDNGTDISVMEYHNYLIAKKKYMKRAKI